MGHGRCPLQHRFHKKLLYSYFLLAESCGTNCVRSINDHCRGAPVSQYLRLHDQQRNQKEGTINLRIQKKLHHQSIIIPCHFKAPGTSDRNAVGCPFYTFLPKDRKNWTPKAIKVIIDILDSVGKAPHLLPSAKSIQLK